MGANVGDIPCGVTRRMYDPAGAWRLTGDPPGSWRFVSNPAGGSETDDKAQGLVGRFV